MLIVIAMSEMFQQCLQEKKDERVLYENLWCIIVSKCLHVVIDNEWWGT